MNDRSHLVGSTSKEKQMSSKLSILLAATALSLSGGLVHATDFPSSSNETGPAAVESSSAAPATGATSVRAPLKAAEFREAGSYDVRTPSSINESAPWLLDGQTVPTVPKR